ncbi:MAG: LysM peptidoglycan-binding domain-containing protein [Clostridia bacterium]|nr:LysM peptidoglycan-binding domain-containing protein [Clostridia bacterium]
MKYRVSKGDTLSRIALKYGTTVNRIVQINDIKNPNLIYIGQILRIY